MVWHQSALVLLHYDTRNRLRGDYRVLTFITRTLLLTVSRKQFSPPSLPFLYLFKVKSTDTIAFGSEQLDFTATGFKYSHSLVSMGQWLQVPCRYQYRRMLKSLLYVCIHPPVQFKLL